MIDVGRSPPCMGSEQPTGTARYPTDLTCGVSTESERCLLSSSCRILWRFEASQNPVEEGAGQPLSKRVSRFTLHRRHSSLLQYLRTSGLDCTCRAARPANYIVKACPTKSWPPYNLTNAIASEASAYLILSTNHTLSTPAAGFTAGLTLLSPKVWPPVDQLVN